MEGLCKKSTQQVNGHHCMSLQGALKPSHYYNRLYDTEMQHHATDLKGRACCRVVRPSVGGWGGHQYVKERDEGPVSDSEGPEEV